MSEDHDGVFTSVSTLNPKNRLRDKNGFALPFPNDTSRQNGYTFFVSDEDGKFRKNPKIVMGPIDGTKGKVGILEVIKLVKYLYDDKNEITKGVFGSKRVWTDGKYDSVLTHLRGALACGSFVLDGTSLEILWKSLVLDRKKLHFARLSKILNSQDGEKYISLNMGVSKESAGGFSLLGLLVFSSMLCGRRREEIMNDGSDHYEKSLVSLCTANMSMAIESCRQAETKRSLPFDDRRKMYAYDSSQRVYPEDALEYMMMRGYMSEDCRKNLRVRLLEKSAFKDSSKEYECTLSRNEVKTHPHANILSLYGSSATENVVSFTTEDGKKMRIVFVNKWMTVTTPHDSFDFNSTVTFEKITEYTVQIDLIGVREKVTLICTSHDKSYTFFGVVNGDRDKKKKVYTFETDENTSELKLLTRAPKEWDTNTMIYWPSKTSLSITADGITTEIVGIPDPYRNIYSRTMKRPLTLRMRYTMYINGFDDGDIHTDPHFAEHKKLHKTKTIRTVGDAASQGSRYLLILNTELVSTVSIFEDGIEIFDKKAELLVKNQSGRSENLFGLYKSFRSRFRGDTWENWKRETNGKFWNKT